MTLSMEIALQPTEKEPMELMIDSYSEERQEHRAEVIEGCGIEQVRFALYMLGQVALTCDEQELMNQAVYRI